jgi:hypothetical protein
MPIDFPSVERRPDEQTEQAPAPYALRAILAAPFRPYDFQQVDPPRDDVDALSFIAPNIAINVRPIVPADFGQAERRQYQPVDDVPNLTLTLTAQVPFVPLDFDQPSRIRQQAIDEVPNILVALAARDPFIPYDFHVIQRVRQPHGEPVQRSYVLYGIPSGFVVHDDCLEWNADPVDVSWAAGPVGVALQADQVVTSWTADPVGVSWTADPRAGSCLPP